ncbi:MAG: Uma2 family endonuclease [Microbacterium sp.]
MATTEAVGLPRGRELTRADLDAMPDDGHRYELIDGVLIVTPAPRLGHQNAAYRIARRLDDACPPELIMVLAPFDVVLASNTIMQPDVLVARRDAFTDRELASAPLLAVEVLSPSTRRIDLMLKKERLERAGCAHYWVVDPDVPSIMAWALVDGAYREVAQASGDEAFEVAEPFAISFAPSQLLD